MTSRLNAILIGIVTALSVVSCGGDADQTGGEATDNTTVAGTQLSVTDLKLIRPDGVEIALTSAPIPRRVTIRATLSAAVNDAADRQAVESSVSLRDPAGNAVAGSFVWSTDFASITYVPGGRFDYATTYSVNLENSSFPTMSLNKADYAGATSFKTASRDDLNGDGYSDVIAGADSAPAGASNGIVYVFLGSANGISNRNLSSENADATLIGAAADDQLGFSSAIAGDVNGDGYADIIAGAHAADAGGTERGMVYIFLGSAGGVAGCDMSSGCPAMASISGPNNYSEFGYSVSGAGDVNGDGYDDVIIGAYNYESSPGVNPGEAYLFFGGPALAGNLNSVNDADARITGDANTDYMGWSVGPAGDVNGDGLDDVIVAANGSTPYYASIFHGGSTLSGNLTPAANGNTRLTGPGSSDSFANSVNTAGDVNGDGFDDVIVGANFADNSGTVNSGAAYIFLGSAGGVADCNMTADPACPHAAIKGAMTEGRLGSAVSTAGDINGDGFDDVMVGADHAGNAGQSMAYLFLGSASGIASCDIKSAPDCPATVIGSKATNDQLGGSMSAAGDINGDGFDDIIIGARLADGPGLNRGEAYIFHGSAGAIADCAIATCTPNTTLSGAHDGERLGYSVY